MILEKERIGAKPGGVKRLNSITPIGIKSTVLRFIAKVCPIVGFTPKSVSTGIRLENGSRKGRRNRATSTQIKSLIVHKPIALNKNITLDRNRRRPGALAVNSLSSVHSIGIETDRILATAIIDKSDSLSPHLPAEKARSCDPIDFILQQFHIINPELPALSERTKISRDQIRIGIVSQTVHGQLNSSICRETRLHNRPLTTSVFHLNG